MVTIRLFILAGGAVLDFLIFSVLCVAAMQMAHVFLRRMNKDSGVPLISWALLFIFIALGTYLANSSEIRQRAAMRSMLEGFAPTYAYNFMQAGHSKIQLDTPPDDPRYLALIETQKNWLRVNPLVNDIYTFRQKPDGSVVLLVDSETDYDHNGKFEGEREVRTAIGEVYPEAGETLNKAFLGTASFDDVPYTDRWGTWVSAYSPLYDESGRVEGVLGVDYAAKNWMMSIWAARYATFGYMAILVIMLIAATLIISITRNEERMLRLASEENKRLARVVDSASDGILITDPNLPDNPVVYANTTFTKMTGYSLAEVLGRNCRFMQGPETDPLAVAEVREAIRKRKGIKISMLNYRKDGTSFWNGLRITPIFTSEGQLQYFLGFQADVTERIKAETQLIAERDYTASIIHGTPTVICGLKPDGQINFLNPAGETVTGYPAGDVIGKNWWATFYPAEEHKQVEKLFEDLKNGPVRDYEMILTAKSGEKRIISWNFLNRSDPKGALIEIIGFGHDVTYRQKLEAQLQQSQKMETVGTLAGGIAHDLNNQLTPLSGYIDIILKDTPPDDPRRDLLMEAEQAARRCAEVVQRLMSVSRTSNQKKVWLRMDRLFTEIKRLFPKVLPSTIRTEVICDDSIWPVHANDTELQTVFMNLAVNARDAMPDGGKLTIQACNMPLDQSRVGPGFKPGNYILITVADTGEGISRENLGKIFEPFFTTKPKGQGTGLGLAMVFRVVKDHGGWVEAQSEIGKGTTMQIFLPADPAAKVEMHRGSEVGQKMPLGHETILFADDEETLRNMGRMFLERLGYKVILAEDGAQAVELYKTGHKEIAAVVLDMTMPKLTGRQALKKILEIDSKAKVLLASGFTAEGTAKELIAEGAVDFLSKPYTIFPLSQMLRKVIDK